MLSAARDVIVNFRNQEVCTQLTKHELEMACIAGLLMSKIAWADTEFDDEEAKAIENFFRTDWELKGNDESNSNAAASVIAEVCAIHVNNEKIPWSQLTQEFRNYYSKEQIDNFIQVCVRVIQADDVIDIRELEALREIALLLHVDPADYLSHLVAQKLKEDELTDALEDVLGELLEEESNFQEVFDKHQNTSDGKSK